MAVYSVQVSCTACPMVHALGIRLSLRHGPADRGSVAEVYPGGVPPPQLTTTIEATFTCPNTGKLYQQQDLSQVFLVRVG